MLEIKTTGFDDYLDGSANIKAMVIGGPGAGKTRWSSFWPKPFFIDCEDGRGSIADRGVPYVRVRSSKDMLDSLAYLKSLETVPKAQRRHQTVVVDTADSFQRIVKEEWVTQTGAGSFSGFDAWGYLDTKMNLLFTRLLNLDYNVVVLVHYKTKEHKEGDNTVREFVLQMQGAVADTVFNDFGLVGWMGTYWGTEDNERVQKRGLTFRPTPDKPFLKDRFHVTPSWMEVTFAESDYDALFQAFTNRADVDDIPEVTSAGAVPDSEAEGPAPKGPVNPPAEGGPLPERPPADIPLDKQTKGSLEKLAKELGIEGIRGNTLKSEIVAMIQAKQAEAATPTSGGSTPQPDMTSSTSPDASSPDDASKASATASTASAEPSAPTESPSESTSSPSSSDDPWQPPKTQPNDPNDPWTPKAPGTVHDIKAEVDQAREEAVAHAEAEANVVSQLGGEVISEEKTDAPDTQPAPPPTPVAQPSSAPAGPSACADCGADLAPFWADPQAKGLVRMSFIKHRKYLCPPCNEKN